MRPDQIVLAFDTSAAHCAVALFVAGKIVAHTHTQMHKGQAEQLMPMIDDTLAKAAIRYSDVTRIGVGTGPGNFTGIRISVSAARGLALSLGIAAIGVTGFDALSFATEGPVLASLPAPRDQIYLQEQAPLEEQVLGRITHPILQAALAQIPAPQHHGCICIGHRSAEIAAHLGLPHAPARLAPAPAIAHIAALTPDHATISRPAPLYMRAPDAAPARDTGPTIL